MLLQIRGLVRNIERRLSLPVNPLAAYGKRVHSQGLQDGIIEHIMVALGISMGQSLEIGAWDGIRFSNTRSLLLQGWQCGYVEANQNKFAELVENIKGYNGTALNDIVSLEEGKTLDDLMDRLGLPEDLSLLCLDIDSHEFWIWRSLQRHRPKVVCIEYNAYCRLGSCVSVPYDLNMSWQGGFFYGASAGALCALADKQGYTLVGFEPGLDLFFVRNDLMPGSKLPVLGVDKVPASPRINPFRSRSGGGTAGMIDVREFL